MCQGLIIPCRHGSNYPTLFCSYGVAKDSRVYKKLMRFCHLLSKTELNYSLTIIRLVGDASVGIFLIPLFVLVSIIEMLASP